MAWFRVSAIEISAFLRSGEPDGWIGLRRLNSDPVGRRAPPVKHFKISTSGIAVNGGTADVGRDPELASVKGRLWE